MKKWAIPLFCLSLPTSLLAADVETRAWAMGGTGTASATPAAAVLYNPALLGLKGNKPATQVILPSLGLRLTAKEDAQDGYQNIDDEDYFDTIDQSVDDINTAIGNTDWAAFDAAAGTFIDSTRGLNEQFGYITREPLNAGAGALFSVASSQPLVGFAVYANASAQLEVTPDISDCDRGLLNEYITIIDNTIGTGTAPAANQTYSCGGTTYNLTDGASNLLTPTDNLDSELFVGAVLISEIGVALSYAFDIGGIPLSVGVTPKMISLTSQVANPTMQDLDDDNYDLGDELEASEMDEDMANLDIGLASRFFDSLTVGVAARNLVSKRFTTAADQNGTRHSFELKPRYSAGVAWQTGALTLAADLDLSKNQAFFNDRESQYLSAGVEYILFHFLDLRAGLRSNLADDKHPVYTAGLGFNIFAFNLDLSAQANADQAAAALQMSLNF